MGQHLSGYTDVTYLQRVDMRLVDYVVLEEDAVALIAYHPIPIYGPASKACFGIIPISTLRDMILAHLQAVSRAKPICLLTVYATRRPETCGLLLVLRLCNAQGYANLNCFEGSVNDDPISGAVYVPHDDKPRLDWWKETCARVADMIAKRQSPLADDTGAAGEEE